MRRNPDRAQNHRLGDDYFDNWTRPIEEPKIEEEDLQREMDRFDTPGWNRVFVTVGSIFFALILVAIVVGAFRLALGL